MALRWNNVKRSAIFHSAILFVIAITSLPAALLFRGEAPYGHAVPLAILSIPWSVWLGHTAYWLAGRRHPLWALIVAVLMVRWAFRLWEELINYAFVENISVWWMVQHPRHYSDELIGPFFSLGPLLGLAIGMYHRGRQHGAWLAWRDSFKELAEQVRQETPIPSVYRRGAAIIDQATKWAILATALLWIFYQRHELAVARSWQALSQSAEVKADAGRSKALEYLASRGTRLNGIRVRGVDLYRLDLDMDFGGIGDTHRSNPSRVNLARADFTDTNLEQARFRGVRGGEAVFDDAIIAGTDFSFAFLVGASFKGAWLGNAGSGYTNFTFADLRNADLSDSVATKEYVYDDSRLNPYTGEQYPLGGAIYLGADLRGATLGERAAGTLLRREIKYGQSFALFSFLSAYAWDSETEVPPSLDVQLRALGLRDGPPELTGVAANEKTVELISLARSVMEERLRNPRGRHPQSKAYFKYLEKMRSDQKIISAIGKVLSQHEEERNQERQGPPDFVEEYIEGLSEHGD